MNSRQFVLRVLLALAALLLTGVLPARAQTSVSINVTTTNDEIQSNGNCSLREAILAANTNQAVDRCPAGANLDTINLPAGIYNFKIGGIDEDLGRTGDLDLGTNIKIVGEGIDTTIIDGQELDRLLHITAAEATVWISDLTLRNGNLHGYWIDGPQKFNPGGGIYNLGMLTLTSVRVYSNEINSGPVDTEGGYSDGGGIYNSGTLIATDTRIDHNETDLEGGGVTSPGKIIFTRVILEGNQGYYSSGLMLGDATGNIIRDSRISNNHVIEMQFAGESAIRLSGDGELLVERTSITGNGGCAIHSDGTLTLRQVIVAHNMGFEDPPTMRLNGVTNISDSTFYDNEGHLLMEVGDNAPVRIERSTFANSEGDEIKGSAIRVNWGRVKLLNSTVTGMGGPQTILVEYGKLTLEGDTIVDNFVTDRGLVVLENGSLIMHNTILANSRHADTGQLVPDCRIVPGTAISQGYNILGNVEGCNWPMIATDQRGEGSAHIDPLLGPLHNNGGITETRALLPGSPAIDHGDPTVFLPIDQRGVTRPQGERIDIGAFELKLPLSVMDSLWMPVILHDE